MEQGVGFIRQLNNLTLNLYNMHFVIEKIKKEISYSKLINSLSNKNIHLNRKILSDIAIKDSSTFEKVVKEATK